MVNTIDSEERIRKHTLTGSLFTLFSTNRLKLVYYIEFEKIFFTFLKLKQMNQTNGLSHS